MILCTSRFTVVSAAEGYFAATSLYAGPMVAPGESLCKRWQVVQSLAPISSSPLLSGAVASGAAVVAVLAESEDALEPELPELQAKKAKEQHRRAEITFFILVKIMN
jgi:hypothetical protein